MSNMLNTDMARLAKTVRSTSPASASPVPADDKSVAEFNRRMSEGGYSQDDEAPSRMDGQDGSAARQSGSTKNTMADKSGLAGRDTPENDTDDKEPDAALRDIFSGMGNPFSRLGALQGAPEAAGAEALSTASAAELADKLVDRILVSQPNEAGQEIRLRLGEGSGINAEVSLLRGLDGTLSVALRAGDPDSFQTLVAAQSRLREALDAQEKNTVRVEVFSSTEEEDNDPHRRSRGYMQQEDEA